MEKDVAAGEGFAEAIVMVARFGDGVVGVGDDADACFDHVDGFDG